VSIIGILLILLALALSHPAHNLLPFGMWKRGALARRLGRLVPRSIDSRQELKKEDDANAVIFRILSVVDPSFSQMEKAVRGLGYTDPKITIAVECAKVALGITLALAAGFVGARWGIRIACAAGLFSFLVSLVSVTQIMSGILRRRSRRLARELIAGVDLLTIFLEGGQSLEQAFRALAEVAGSALPALAVVQRTLISDIENGVSFERGLDRWAASLGTESAGFLATLFKETLLHGTELVPQLRRFVVDLQEKRLLTAKERIGKKSAQLTMVMVAFFLPAILIFTGGPAFVGLISALGKMQ
jgi:tight adherence protein C